MSGLYLAAVLIICTVAAFLFALGLCKAAARRSIRPRAAATTVR